MDSFQSHKVAILHSSSNRNSSESPQKKNDRLPPVPLPKPKIKPQIHNQANDNESSKCLNVRKAILKGSRNPSGFEISFNHDLSVQSQISPNHDRKQKTQTSDFSQEIFEKNGEERNSWVYPNERKSEHLEQERHGKIDTDQNSSNRYHSPNKKLELDHFFPDIAREKRHHDDKTDSDYLLPKLERQLNQVVVLAENNPNEVNGDIVRNCVALEEVIPERGHTGNLLRYWERGDVSSEPARRKSNIQQDNHIHIENANVDGSRLPPKFETKSEPRTNENVVVTENFNNLVLQELFNSSDSHYLEPSTEKVFDDILQELESFNKDIFDETAGICEDFPHEEKHEMPKEDSKLDIDYILPKYDSVPTINEKCQDNHVPEIQTQGDSIYDELDHGQLIQETHHTRHHTDSFRSSPRPALEYDPQDVTLISFRKLNEEEQNSERSSCNLSNSPSRHSRTDHTPQEPNSVETNVFPEPLKSPKSEKSIKVKQKSSKKPCLLM